MNLGKAPNFNKKTNNANQQEKMHKSTPNFDLKKPKTTKIM